MCANEAHWPTKHNRNGNFVIPIPGIYRRTPRFVLFFSMKWSTICSDSGYSHEPSVPSPAQDNRFSPSSLKPSTAHNDDPLRNRATPNRQPHCPFCTISPPTSVTFRLGKRFYWWSPIYSELGGDHEPSVPSFAQDNYPPHNPTSSQSTSRPI